MQGIILAAGKGKRLQQLTRYSSKAMLPVAGKPMIQRVAESMIGAGLKELLVVVPPGDDDIRRHFESSGIYTKIAITIVIQPEPKGMADALRYVLPYIRSAFLVSACDNWLSEEVIRGMIEKWNSSDWDALLALTPVCDEEVERMGIVGMVGEKITTIVEKPKMENAPSRIGSIPVYIFSSKILTYLVKVQLSTRGEYELQDAIQLMIRDGQSVGGWMIKDRKTYNTLNEYMKVVRFFVEKEGTRDCWGKDGMIVQGPVYIGENVMFGRDVQIGPYTALEAGCRIEDGARVSECIVWSNATVRMAEVIHRQVILPEEYGYD